MMLWRLSAAMCGGLSHQRVYDITRSAGRCTVNRNPRKTAYNVDVILLGSRLAVTGQAILEDRDSHKP